MSENVGIKINIKDGNIEIQAPVESLEMIFDKLGAFIPKFADAQTMMVDSDHKDTVVDEEKQPENAINVIQEKQSKEEKTVKKEKSSASKKKETYKTVELNVSSEKRDEFREFYKVKNPSSQNDQVLTVMYWLAKHANKPITNKDEIYTGLRTVNERIPGRISSVLSNLRIEGKVVLEGNGTGYRLHHTGEDYVERDLPKEVAGKK
jgi:folylpolyglutamate synthase/dihydropteroate synthase